MNGLVEKEALEEIKKNYKRLSLPQRQEFELIKSDIVITFAHHVRIETLKEGTSRAAKVLSKWFITFFLFCRVHRHSKAHRLLLHGF